MLLASLTVAATLAYGPNEPTQQQDLAPPNEQVSVLYLANEGFLIRSGDIKILIDSFVGETEDGFETLPRNVTRMLTTAAAPFDGFALALVSHTHRDHLQVRMAEKYLRANANAAVLAAPSVLQSFTNRAEDFDSIKEQLRSVNLEGVKSKRYAILDTRATVDFMPLPHGGDATVANFGHLITLGEHRLLHLGDVAADKAIFEGLDLASQKIEVAFVPYWFFMTEEGIDIVDNSINAQYTIACHVPMDQKEAFIAKMAESNPHILHFNAPMESKVFTISTDAIDK